MLAFKRLQQPDALFGHPERTAKVAFAEPIKEPDAEVMAQVLDLLSTILLFYKELLPKQLALVLYRRG